MAFRLPLLLLLVHVAYITTPFATGSRPLLPEDIDAPALNVSSSPVDGSCPAFASALGFGDSTTDTGNDIINNRTVFNNSAHFPYGETYFHRASGRYSDGRLMVDYLMTSLGQPLLTPYLFVRPAHNKSSNSSSLPWSPAPAPTEEQRTHQNFAFSGASALDEATLVRIAGESVRRAVFTKIDLKEEMRWFDAAVHEQDLDLSRTVVYFGEIGGNDYNYAIGSGVNTTTVVPLLVRPVIARVAAAINHVLRRGVRYLVVQGQFPQGCLSLYMTLLRGASHPGDYDSYGCIIAVNRISAMHNRLLRQVVVDARKAYPDAQIVYHDTYYAYYHLLENAASYNITNTDDACDSTDALRFSGGAASAFVPRVTGVCKNPQNYLSWDSVHMTDATYGVMAGLFAANRRFAAPFPNFVSTCANQHSQ